MTIRPETVLALAPAAHPAPLHPVRLLPHLARALRRTAARLHRLARWLQATSAPRAPAGGVGELPRIEFHAQAGAPEGALYVDGTYIGRLPVDRL